MCLDSPSTVNLQLIFLCGYLRTRCFQDIFLSLSACYAVKQTNQCSKGWLKRESLVTTKVYKVYKFDNFEKVAGKPFTFFF